MTACGVFASHISGYIGHDHMLAQPGTYATGHDLSHSEESSLRHKTAMWWGRGINGEAFRQLANWMPPGTVVDDPEIGLNPVVPDNAAFDDDWRLVQPSIETTMRIVCDNCMGFNILRRFSRKCDPITFSSALGFGLVIVPNFQEEAWVPRSTIRTFAHLSASARRDTWG